MGIRNIEIQYFAQLCLSNILSSAGILGSELFCKGEPDGASNQAAHDGPYGKGARSHYLL